MEDESKDKAPAIRDTGQKHPVVQLWHMGIVTKRPQEIKQLPQTTAGDWHQMASEFQTRNYTKSLIHSHCQ